jgi:thiol:disulfide interchange protein
MKYILACLLFVGIFVNSVSAKPTKELYVFGADWCSYCKLLEKYVLSDEKVQVELSDIKVRHIDIDKHKDVLKAWKVKSVPAVILVDRIDLQTAKILGRWQLGSISANNTRSHQKNIRSFLDFLEEND